MQNEQFSPYQFLDAASLNAISSAVSGNIDSLAVALAGPGLLRPDLLVLTPSGLSLTATMPAPFGALFGNGVLAFANGSVPGQSSDATTISLAGLVPVSGPAVTAYVYLTQSNVNEGPFQVTGPPPGHPDYNPNFAAYTAYAQNWDSLTLNASTSAPDGSTELLLCSTTLASGQSSLGTLLTGGQKLATPLPTQNFVNVTTNKALAATDAGVLQRLTAAVYLTLPDVSVGNRMFPFACRSSGCTIQTLSSGEFIYGFSGGPATSIIPVSGSAGAFISDGVSWQLLYSAAPLGNVAALNAGIGLTVSGSFLNVTTPSPFSAKYTSSPQGFPGSGGTLNFAHGFGAVPFGYQPYLYCVNNDSGWTAGQMLKYESNSNTSSNQGSTLGRCDLCACSIRVQYRD